MISVVIPTVSGREGLLEQTQAAFRATCDEPEFVVVQDYETCGEGWNAGLEHASGEYVLLTGDDLIPHEGWAEVAVDAADAYVYPAPAIYENGELLNCGTLGQGLYVDGRDGLPVFSSPIPFFKREKWETLGPCIPVHYYSDDYLAYRARFKAGLSVEVRRRYAFTHLDGKPGKQRNVALGQQSRLAFAEKVSEL